MVASLDIDPKAKVSRLLKAVERLCTTPRMLEEATAQLMALLTPPQMSKAVVETVDATLTAEETMSLCSDVLRSLGSIERAALLEKEMVHALSPAECAAAIEPVLAQLPEAQRTVLMPVLVESSGSENERLALVKMLLEWRISKPPPPPANYTRGFGPSPGEARRSVVAGIVDDNNLRAVDLAHSDRFLKVLIGLWDDSAVERVAALLGTMEGLLRKRACGQILASGAVDALQLEQALELIYNAEEEEVDGNPLARAELSKRRRESALARNMLREGRSPKLLAGPSRVCAADANEDGLEASAGGWRLTCDCTRQWVLPSALLGKLKGEKGENAPALSIRRYEDVRFESVEQRAERDRNRAPRVEREKLAVRSVRANRRGGMPSLETKLPFEQASSAADDESGKAAWHMSTSSLLAVVADLWNGVLVDGKLGESRRGLRQLDVAAVLWERLLHKHALKSVAQRALADLTSSLHAEAVSPGCIGRLRLAAEMIGLGREEVPWSEAKAHFFFWMLPLCVPQKRMKQHLNDVHVQLPLSAVVQFLNLAIKNPDIRDDLIEKITPVQPEAEAMSPALAVPEWGGEDEEEWETREVVPAPMPAPAPAPTPGRSGSIAGRGSNAGPPSRSGSIAGESMATSPSVQRRSMRQSIGSQRRNTLAAGAVDEPHVYVELKKRGRGRGRRRVPCCV